MKFHANKIWKMTAAATVVLGLAACVDQKGAAHKEEVNNANTRWHTIRSSMMLQLAQQQFDTGDLDQAEKTLADAIGIDPKNARLHVLAGRIGLERGQLERAYQRLATAVSLDPKLPESYYFQGIVLQRWQRYADALAAYQSAYTLQADNADFLLAMAEMMAATDKVDDAIKLLTDKITYFDQNAGIRAALAQLYTLNKQPDKAVDYYRQAIQLKPEDTQLLEALALAQIDAGKYDDATRNLERLLADKAQANRRDLLIALASANERAGRAAAAREIYIKLTHSNPADPQPWVKLAQSSWAQGDAAAALLAANRAIALSPKTAEGYLIAGLVWQKRGNVTEALRNFDRAAEYAPQNSDAVILRGITLQRSGDTRAAALAYAEALRRNPDNARAQSLLASVEENHADPR